MVAFSTPFTQFSHRQNSDGTIASICKECDTVIATSQWEADLETPEDEHRCDPIRLEYVRQLMMIPPYQ